VKWRTLVARLPRHTVGGKGKGGARLSGTTVIGSGVTGACYAWLACPLILTSSAASVSVAAVGRYVFITRAVRSGDRKRVLAKRYLGRRPFPNGASGSVTMCAPRHQGYPGVSPRS
jgi:hypothetical protein